MNKHTPFPNLPYFTIILLMVFMLLAGHTRFALAAGLRIEPAAPIIAVGESIPLTVFGAEGKITWIPEAGNVVEETQTRVVYVAPNQVGQYYVTVLDANNAPSSIEVTVLPLKSAKNAFSREKSVWEVFTNRSNISAITLSDDKKTLWVGTHGGLEKRDAITGELIKVLTNLDGLPNNFITSIVDDGKGGLWVGTSFGGGIAYMNSHKQWKVFNTDNSSLPDNVINALVSDGNGGIWIATGIPFDEDKINGWLDSFSNQSSISGGMFGNNGVLGGLFGDLFGNEQGGLFGNEGQGNIFGSESISDNLIGELSSFLDCSDDASLTTFLFSMFGFGDFGESEGGLAHLSGDGQWTIFNTENTPDLPSDIISDIANDGNGGLWVGTHCGGLGHLNAQREWKFYNKSNSALPGNFINILTQDENGGLWIATAFNGLAHLSNQGEWKVYNKANHGLPSNTINKPVSDGNGGVWVGTGNILEKAGGLVHIQANGTVQLLDTVNSKLAGNTIIHLADDQRGGLWLGTYGAGLVNWNKEKNLTLLSKTELEKSNTNSGLPDNIGYILMNDGEEGVWAGMSSWIYDSGLAYFNNSRNEWNIYNTSNGLPANDIFALAKDQNDELWVGTIGGGLAHLNNACKWTVYNTNNSPLPDDDIAGLLHDERNGLWIGTANGLAYRSYSGDWTIFNTANSGLPDNTIGNLANDDQGGLWVGTAFGLAHWQRDENKWTVYNETNSQLPHNLVADLLDDANGGLWIATGSEKQGGLVHLTKNNEWIIYNTVNNPDVNSDFQLPSNAIRALASDNSGGIWIGTLKGLVHRSIRGNWTLFDTTNSGLQNDRILDIANDGKNGLWVLGFGLAHLTFSQKPFICETVPNISDEDCTKLLNSHRAAIIVHPNGIGSGYDSDIAIDNMATHVYQTLFLRGYDHDEINYIAYRPNIDFNGDGTADFEVVDAPTTLKNYVADDNKEIENITIEHIKHAFEWAKEKSHRSKVEGVPEEPLVVIFVTHGSPDELLLGPSGNTLDESTLKELLYDYQTETGNQVTVILEACYTGTLVDALQAPNRLIVTSTNDNLAYYKNFGRTSFTSFYFNDLYRGTDYWTSQRFVRDHVFAQLGQPFNQQEPQLEDSAENIIAQDLCLNGCFIELPAPILTPEKAPRFIVSDTIDLAVDINDGSDELIQSIGVMCGVHSVRQDRILGVSMSVIGPQDDEYSAQGFETSEPLLIENLSRGENGKWFTRFTELSEPGEYNFIFRAEYKIRSGRRTASALEPVTVDFQSCQTHANYDMDTQTLHLPAVNIEGTLYQADYLLTSFEPITLELNSDSMGKISDADSACLAYLDSDTFMLYVPAVDIPNNVGGIDTYNGVLQGTPDTPKFTLESLILQ